jgi:sugar lactone lactonase YvrE
MSYTITRRFRAPYAVPNGLQMTPDGLWVVDQITDRVALIDPSGPNDYGVTMLRREIATESSNTSGLTWGADLLWLAANGSSSIWRAPRAADALAGQGEVLAVDPNTGATVARHPVPGGGVHGIEYDPYDRDTLWITTLHAQTLTAVRTTDWSVQRVLPLPYPRAHGVVRVADGLWVVHTSHRVIVKLDVATGAECARIDVPPDLPEPHCLTRIGEALVYCDATSGWLATIDGIA